MNYSFVMIILFSKKTFNCRRGVVGRVPAFQPAAARVRLPAGSGILISVLGLGVCPLSVFCSVAKLVVFPLKLVVFMPV